MGELIAIAIYPDKRVEDVHLPMPPASILKSLQEIVEGWIEAVGLSDGSTMYVNEEGLYRFGPEDFNSIATDVCGLGGRPDIMLGAGIRGPVAILGPLDADGYDTTVTDKARRWVRRVAREARLGT